MIGFFLAFSTYIILLTIMKKKKINLNIKLKNINNSTNYHYYNPDNLNCGEPICY